ncbi:MAG TPA: hypothetical protein VHL11_07865, partial [Phototrophicaceae bacterium]|nr:hypothetical protein [Phototrophicaceae bacterium]
MVRTGIKAGSIAVIMAVTGSLILLIGARAFSGIAWHSNEIAYICTTRNGNSHICLRDINLGFPRDLMWEIDGWVNDLSWSSDGQQILFEGSIRGASGIYRLDIRDRQMSLILRGGHAPALSPDGRQIAFHMDREVSSPDAVLVSDIFIMNADGTNPHRLTSPEAEKDRIYNYHNNYYNPVWSPDGSQIAFQGGGAGLLSASDIYLMWANGSHMRQLTDASQIYFDPAWSPDGTKLAGFASDGLAIFTIDVNG